MIISYLEQLEKIAQETGWSLKEACVDAGISDTTYYRWVNQTSTARKKQADTVASHMLKFRR